MSRGDRDDAPVAASAERLPPVPREQEGAREEEGDDRVPFVLREVGHRTDVLYARVGHDHVETAEAVERRLDRAGVALAGGEVGPVWLSGPGAVRLDVDGQHVEAVGGQALGHRAPDAARRAGYD